MMELKIDTSVPLTAVEKEILQLLLGGGVTTVEEPVKPARTPRAKAAPKAEPEPEPDEDEDLLGGNAPTLDDAIALATRLVSEGKAKEVKEALAVAGAKKVSDLKGDKIAVFIGELDG